MTARDSRHVRKLILSPVTGFAISIGLAGLPAATPAAAASGEFGAISSSPNVTVKHSANWAGNVATGHTYEDAYGYWRIPDVGKNNPPFAAASSQWVGIGLGNSKNHPLVQAGTEADIHVGLNQVTYYMWWQVVPENSHQRIIQLGNIVSAGNLMFAHIHLSKNNAYITLKDVTDNAGTTLHFNRNGQTITPDGHAEWIDERTEETFIGSTYPPLADSTVTFTHAQASAPGLSKRGVGNLPHFDNTMWTCKRPIVEMAVPLRITQNGTKFTIQWKHFGHSDKPGCTPG